MTNQHNSQKFQGQGQKNAGPVVEETKPFTKEWKKGLYEGEDEGKLEAALEKEIREAGLHYKFIDYKQAKSNGNRSRKNWIIYSGLQGEKEPVRRGTLVLAVKNDANYRKQISQVELQRKAMNRYNTNKAEELNREAQSLGGTSQILAGFDQNG